jgi:MATE family multidrug resistance protein
MVALLIPWPLMVLPTFILKDQSGSVYLAWGAASFYIIIQSLIFWRRFVGGKWKQMSVIN